MTPTLANVGVPMLVLYWPVMVLALIPIVVVEASVYRLICGKPIKRWIVDVAIANGVSTIAGIPLTWLLLVISQMTIMPLLASVVPSELITFETTIGRLAAVVSNAPWVVPYQHHIHWLVPSAGVLLVAPFLIASVLIEHWIIARRHARRSPDEPRLSRMTAWKANGCSYALVAAYWTHLLYSAVW